MALYELETRHDHTALAMVSDTRDTPGAAGALSLFLQEPDVEMDFVRPHTPYDGQTGVPASDDLGAHFYGAYADDDDFVLKVNGTAVDRTVSAYYSGKLVQMIFGSALLKDDDGDGDVDLYAEGVETNVGMTPVSETWTADVLPTPPIKLDVTAAIRVPALTVTDVTTAIGVKAINYVTVTGSIGFRPKVFVPATTAIPQRALAALKSEATGRVFVGDLVIFPDGGGTANLAEVYRATDGSGTLTLEGTAIFDIGAGSLELQAYQLFDEAAGSANINSVLLFDEGSGSLNLGLLELSTDGGGTGNLVGFVAGTSMGSLVIRVSTIGPRLARELAVAGVKLDWEAPFLETQSEFWIDEA